MGRVGGSDNSSSDNSSGMGVSVSESGWELDTEDSSGADMLSVKDGTCRLSVEFGDNG